MSAAARSSLTPAVIETPDADAVLTLAHGVDADANLVLVKLRASERRLVHGSDSFHLNARAAGSSEFHSLSLLPGLVFVVNAGFLLQGSGRGRVVGLSPFRVVTFDTIHIRLTLSRVAF